MAVIREELVLYDKFTNTFTSYIRQAQQAAGATGQARNITNQFSQSQKAAATSTSNLANTLKNLIGTYAGFKGIQTLFNLSDQLASTKARLDMMNDGLQTTDELNDMIWQSAMRSRGSYADTAAFVAKLGTLAGNAFSSNGEIIQFAEQLNKQMVLSGTATQEAQAAMYQLTQGLSSGVLRGEELNSVIEQTPMIAQTIADYMGVTTGEMRELASQGVITADVVKNALLDAAEETNAKFEEMPLTWGQVWTMMQNIAIKALQPVLDGVNWLANHIDDALDWVADHADGVAAVLAGLGAMALVVGAQMVASAVASAIAWAAANWPILLVGAAVASLIYIALKAGATFEQVGAAIGVIFGHLYANAMNFLIVPLQRSFAMFANFLGNVFNDPVAAVQILFLDMALNILGKIQAVAHGIEDLINKIPGLNVNLTSGIDNLYNWVKGASQNVKDASGWQEYVKAWDYVDYSEAWGAGAALGGKIGAALEDFNLEEFLGGLGGSFPGGGGGELLERVAGIGDSVKGIEKSVSMSEEDIKSLVDVAERRYVNNVNLTAQTPVITINGANTGNTAADRKSLADAIQRILMEQMAAGSVRSTARAW